MWYIYIIKSVLNNRYYIGCTSNIERRILEHNNGYNISTKKDKPWKVVYCEEFNDQQKAYSREKKIKSYKGGNAFKKLLNS